jgi:hypothetical protein
MSQIVLWDKPGSKAGIRNPKVIMNMKQGHSAGSPQCVVGSFSLRNNILAICPFLRNKMWTNLETIQKSDKIFAQGDKAGDRGQNLGTGDKAGDRGQSWGQGTKLGNRGQNWGQGTKLETIQATKLVVEIS